MRLALLLIPFVLIVAAVVVALFNPRPAGAPVSDPEADARQLHGAQIAYRIRAELVCCSLYDRLNAEGRTPTEAEMRQVDSGMHSLCYWGDAAAHIAEDPLRWQDELVRLGQDNPTDGER